MLTLSHRTDVHDTQGPRDEGVDVLLNYADYDGQHRAGLQIKSHHEIEDWRKGPRQSFHTDVESTVHRLPMQNLKVDRLLPTTLHRRKLNMNSRSD